MPPETQLGEIVVEAQRPVSAASSLEAEERDFQVRPHFTINQMLNNVPGVLVSQHQGGAKAAQYFLRGFDADHGTDVAVYADELPVNMVTHAHGQGYADLNFLIPETVERVEVYKGPYFVQFGDFDTAGALRLVTKETFQENFALAEGGSFATQRYVVGASPQLGNAKALFAGQAYYTNGPFENPENLAKYNGMSRFTFDPTPQTKLVTTFEGYAADWDASGQLPEPQVASGALDRFGSIDPTEGGRTDRENLLLDWSYRPTTADTVETHLYGSRYKLRLWSDFTFFANTGLRFVQLPNGAIVDTEGEQPFNPEANYIPGDEVYQGDSRYLYGGVARYTHNWFLAGVPLQSQVAAETRSDDIHLKLQRTVRRETYFTTNEVYVREHSFSGYWGQQIFFNDWIRFDGGLRGDAFTFNVDNRLPDQATDPNFSAVYLQGRTSDWLLSPKANLIFTPAQNTDVYLNFGRGFHSNDARANITGAFAGATEGTGVQTAAQATPLVKALGYELGSRTKLFDQLELAAALWNLNLGSELTFNGDTGTDEASSQASRRWGTDFEARWQIRRWLFADYDLNWAQARFSDGGYVPLAVPLFMNGGLTAQVATGLEIGLRARWIGDRPANEAGTQTAQGYYLVDLIGRYRWRNVETLVQLLNVTNADWREAQFSDNSCVRSQEQTGHPNRACYYHPGLNPVTPPEAIHFTPGNPIGVIVGLKVFF